MPLSDGEPAYAGDVWLRIATHKDYIKDGRVLHGAFGGRAIGPPDAEKQRPWDRELSGRLRSLAGSAAQIATHAEQFCVDQTLRGGGKKIFHGVMYSRVREIKKTYKETIQSNVHFTPDPPSDLAHADLTFSGWDINDKPQLEEFTLWLSDNLHALYPAQVGEHLPNAEPISIVSRAVCAIRALVRHLVQRLSSTDSRRER
jgi:hypothetical protein